MRQRENGFTLIEVLIVVAIIGILAAIAIPNLITAMERSKQKRTMADMRSIALAWESRAIDAGSYSSAGISLCCTVPISLPHALTIFEPTFMRPFPRHDGWLRPYELTVNTDSTQYQVRSYARDGLRDDTVVGGGTHGLDCDIIYSGGQFIQYPEGIQSQ